MSVVKTFAEKAIVFILGIAIITVALAKLHGFAPSVCWRAAQESITSWMFWLLLAWSLIAWLAADYPLQAAKTAEARPEAAILAWFVLLLYPCLFWVTFINNIVDPILPVFQ